MVTKPLPHKGRLLSRTLQGAQAERARVAALSAQAAEGPCPKGTPPSLRPATRSPQNQSHHLQFLQSCGPKCRVCGWERQQGAATCTDTLPEDEGTSGTCAERNSAPWQVSEVLL